MFTRQAFSDPNVSRLQTTLADLSCPAHRQAAQIHSSSSSKRRKGLQSYVKDADALRNGANSGQSLPSKADSANGALPASGMAGRYGIPQPRETDNSQSTSTMRQLDSPTRPLQPSYMPPHLFTARRRELQQSNSHHEEMPLPGSRVLKVDDSTAAEQALKATLPPAELGDMGEKAEGVIQIGASGVRIPLYGKSMQAIQEVCAHTCGQRQRCAD